MNIEQKINDAIKSAMLAKNEAELRALRAIKSAIIIFKTSSEYKGEISEIEEIKIFQKLIKQRNDSVAIYEKQNRQDLLEKEKQEIAVIEKFLPKQLTIEEVKEIAKKIKVENNINNISEMGKLIGLVNKEIAGKSDGKIISQVVKQLLD